jgi:sulfatase maturation enzyme AslB (radical SAM superfamily)
MLERLSIELTNRCGKACWFCYNTSRPEGATTWSVAEVVDFVRDCSQHGVKAVSFGGGEPLEYDGLFDVLAELRGVVFRSMTTNGLLLSTDIVTRLVEVGIDKVHVSLHFPGNARELARVIATVHTIADAGIKSGVNLLVARSALADARAAAGALHDAGITNERIVYLPMRGQDTPTPREVADVAAGPFQSMTCLSTCGRSPRFVAIRWDKTVAWCSYTTARRPLDGLTFAALERALENLELTFCGGTDDGLVRLPRRAQHGHDLVRGGS